MENLINLEDLLNHEILDLYSAEKQIIEALPAMINEAHNAQLKNALEEHLEVTQTHKERLEKIYESLTGNKEEPGNLSGEKGFFSRLFGGISEPKCKGMDGLISEGKKIISENMTPEVRDAVIISAAQKIEHYEIAGYGTALAYAKQLNDEFAATLLEETLNEEYEADDLLTELAVEQLNIDAENAVDDNNGDTYTTHPGLTSGIMDDSSLVAGYAHDVTHPVANDTDFDSDIKRQASDHSIF